MRRSTLPQYISEIILESMIELYEESNNFLESLQEYLQEVKLGIDYDFTTHTNNPFTARVEFFKALEKLETKEGKKLDLDFTIYWLEKFKQEGNKVREAVIKVNGIDNTIFRPISENIGQIYRTAFAINSNTSPIWDTEMTFVPKDIDSITFNRMLPAARRAYLYSTKLNTALQRKNIINLQSSDVQVSESGNVFFTGLPHGENLITDMKYFYDLEQNVIDATQVIIDYYDILYPVIQFISDFNPQDPSTNLQNAVKPVMLLKDGILEGIKVDILSNRVRENIKEVKSYDILSSSIPT